MTKKTSKPFGEPNFGYHFNDVYIVPQYSDILTRSRVDTTSILDPELDKTQIKVPVISANMDTVTDGSMAKAMAEAGAIGAIHRFCSIQDNVEEWVKVGGLPTLVSVGVSSESKERAQALYVAGAKHFIIDIAHGHHYLMKNMIQFFRKELPNCFLVCGNVATPEAVKDLVNWGADAIKIGIGPGAACTTKNITGVTVPQFSAIDKCSDAAKELSEKLGKEITVIADGGIREIGDIAKSLGAGADFVMCGKMFAGCPEAPHPGVYRGMASLDAMKNMRTSDRLPTPEGRTLAIKPDMHVSEVVDLIAGGLRSSFSYSNALDLEEFQNKCRFGIYHK